MKEHNPQYTLFFFIKYWHLQLFPLARPLLSKQVISIIIKNNKLNSTNAVKAHLEAAGSSSKMK